MACEICSQSLRTVGACTGAVEIAATKSSGAMADSFSSRVEVDHRQGTNCERETIQIAFLDCSRVDHVWNSLCKAYGLGRKLWSPRTPTHVGFGVRKSLQKGYQGRSQSLNHASLRPRVIADAAGQDSFGCFGALTTTDDGFPEKLQSAGPGISTLEKWLESYLAEIVRHLPEAPFLQFIPKYNSLCGERKRLSEELFEKPESWQSVKHCLVESAPDGIILVHRLDQECCSSDCNSTGESSSRTNTSLQAGSSSTDVWGVLVHGCKTRSNACYILKTTQVASSTGILTHFCVVRAKCLGPSIKSQLESTWLL